MAELSTFGWLFEPLPEQLPAVVPGRSGRGRLFAGFRAALGGRGISAVERVERRVRRGKTQAVVREA